MRGRVPPVAALALGLAAAAAAGELRVVTHDGRPVPAARVATGKHLATTEEDGTVKVAAPGPLWVAPPAGPPVRLEPAPDGTVRLPPLEAVQVTVLEAGTGRRLAAGRLRWLVAGAPAPLLEREWSAPSGVLRLLCPDRCLVELLVPGHRRARVRLEAGVASTAVKLPRGRTLHVTVRPGDVPGRVLWAPADALGLLATFETVARATGLDPGRPLELELEAGRRYLGLLLADGWAPLPFEIGPETTAVTLRLERGLTLSGRVVSERGEPIAGATVEVHGAVAARDLVPYLQRSRTGPEGRFSVPGLLAGTAVVRALAPGRAAAVREVRIGEGGPLELELPPGLDLRLHLVDQFGTPVAGARVEVEGFRYASDRKGLVRVPGVQVGAALEVRITGSGVVPFHDAVRVEGPEATLRLVRGGRIVWPLLVDPPELGSDGDYGWVELLESGREGRAGTARWDAEHARVVAEGLRAGRYRLQARLPGFAPLLSEPVAVAAGEETALPPAVPDPGRAIVGVVVDGDTGEPVAGAEVRAEPGDGTTFRTPRDLETAQRATSDAEGRFRVAGLAAREYTLRIRAAGFAERRIQVTPDEGGTDLGEIELDRGLVVTGRVVDREGAGVEGAEVALWEPGAYVFEPHATTTADGRGRFRLDLIPAGRWRLEARSGGRHGETEVEGAAGDEVEAEIVVGGVTVEGRVWLGDEPVSGGRLILVRAGAEPGGAAVAVARPDGVRLFGPGLGPRHATTVGPDGGFHLEGVDPGAYTAAFSPDLPGAGAMTTAVTVPDAATAYLDLRFPDGSVAGTVLDPWERPVPGARVTLAAGGATRHAVAGAGGAFRFGGLPAGRVRLVAAHSEFRDSEPVEVDLDEGGAEEGVVLRLRPPAGGTVRLALEPAVGAAAGAPAVLAGPVTRTAFADGAGVASWEGLPQGTYRACARAFGGALGCTEPFQLDEDGEVELTLSTGRGGAVRVVGAGPGAVRVALPDGTSLGALAMLSGALRREGNDVVVGPLEPGTYAVTVAGWPGPRLVEVREGETTRVGR